MPQVIRSRGKLYQLQVVQSSYKKAKEVADVFTAYGKKAIVRKYTTGRRWLGNWGVYVNKGK